MILLGSKQQLRASVDNGAGLGRWSQKMLSNVPHDIYRYYILAQLTDFERLVFRCTCRFTLSLVRQLYPTTLHKCKHKLYEYAVCSVKLLDWLFVDQRIGIPYRAGAQKPLINIAASGNFKDSILWFQRNMKPGRFRIEDDTEIEAGTKDDSCNFGEYLYMS